MMPADRDVAARGDPKAEHERAEWLARERAYFGKAFVLAAAFAGALVLAFDAGGPRRVTITFLFLALAWATTVVARWVAYRSIKRERSGWVAGRLSIESTGGRRTRACSGLLLSGGVQCSFSSVRHGTALIPDKSETTDVIVPAGWTTRTKVYVIAQDGRVLRLRY